MSLSLLLSTRYENYILVGETFSYKSKLTVEQIPSDISVYSGYVIDNEDVIEPLKNV